MVCHLVSITLGLAPLVLEVGPTAGTHLAPPHVLAHAGQSPTPAPRSHLTVGVAGPPWVR